MRKVIVFVSSILLVLSAGVAMALITSGEKPVSEEAAKTTTTSEVEAEKTSPPSTESVELEKEADSKTTSDSDSDDSKDRKKSKDTKAPKIAVLSPEEGSHFSETHLAFEGETEPGAKVLAGKWEADVTKDGHWRIVLILSEGGNTVKFTAVDEAGNEGHAQVTVYLDKQEPKEDTADHEFTAHQKYGSCNEDVPYDVWYGNGKPGTKVFVASEFGSGNGVVGEGGHWEIKVKFPEAPCNEHFKVVLETDDGHRKVYEFIRVCGDKHPDDGHEGEK